MDYNGRAAVNKIIKKKKQWKKKKNTEGYTYVYALAMGEQTLKEMER